MSLKQENKRILYITITYNQVIENKEIFKELTDRAGYSNIYLERHLSYIENEINDVEIFIFFISLKDNNTFGLYAEVPIKGTYKLTDLFLDKFIKLNRITGLYFEDFILEMYNKGELNYA